MSTRTYSDISAHCRSDCKRLHCSVRLQHLVSLTVRVGTHWITCFSSRGMEKCGVGTWCTSEPPFTRENKSMCQRSVELILQVATWTNEFSVSSLHGDEVTQVFAQALSSQMVVPSCPTPPVSWLQSVVPRPVSPKRGGSCVIDESPRLHAHRELRFLCEPRPLARQSDAAHRTSWGGGWRPSSYV